MIIIREPGFHYLNAKSGFVNFCEYLLRHVALYQYFNNNCLFQLAKQYKRNCINKFKLIIYKKYSLQLRYLKHCSLKSKTTCQKYRKKFVINRKDLYYEKLCKKLKKETKKLKSYNIWITNISSFKSRIKYVHLPF